MQIINLKPGRAVIFCMLMRWDPVHCKQVYRQVRGHVMGFYENDINGHNVCVRCTMGGQTFDWWINPRMVIA